MWLLYLQLLGVNTDRGLCEPVWSIRRNCHLKPCSGNPKMLYESGNEGVMPHIIWLRHLGTRDIRYLRTKQGPKPGGAKPP